jgi:hypothetical protein
MWRAKRGSLGWSEGSCEHVLLTSGKKAPCHFAVSAHAQVLPVSDIQSRSLDRDYDDFVKDPYLPPLTQEWDPSLPQTGRQYLRQVRREAAQNFIPARPRITKRRVEPSDYVPHALEDSGESEDGGVHAKDGRWEKFFAAEKAAQGYALSAGGEKPTETPTARHESQEHTHRQEEHAGVVRGAGAAKTQESTGSKHTHRRVRNRAHAGECMHVVPACARGVASAHMLVCSSLVFRVSQSACKVLRALNRTPKPGTRNPDTPGTRNPLHPEPRRTCTGVPLYEDIVGDGVSVVRLHSNHCVASRTPYNLHPTYLHPLHPIPYTLHPAPCTLHPTPNTLHPTPYTL